MGLLDKLRQLKQEISNDFNKGKNTLSNTLNGGVKGLEQYLKQIPARGQYKSVMPTNKPSLMDRLLQEISQVPQNVKQNIISPTNPQGFVQKVAVPTAKYTYQPITRGGSSIALSTLKRPQLQPQTPLQKLILGKEPVVSVGERMKYNQQWAQQHGVSSKFVKPLGAGIGLAGLAFDIAPFGIGGKNVAENLAKETTEQGVKKLLGKWAVNFNDDVIKQIAKTKDESIIKKLLETPTERIVGVGKGIKENPLVQEARKYKSAEEFVVAKQKEILSKVDEETLRDIPRLRHEIHTESTQSIFGTNSSFNESIKEIADTIENQNIVGNENKVASAIRKFDDSESGDRISIIDLENFDDEYRSLKDAVDEATTTLKTEQAERNLADYKDAYIGEAFNKIKTEKEKINKIIEDYLGNVDEIFDNYEIDDISNIRNGKTLAPSGFARARSILGEGVNNTAKEKSYQSKIPQLTDLYNQSKGISPELKPKLKYPESYFAPTVKPATYEPTKEDIKTLISTTKTFKERLGIELSQGAENYITKSEERNLYDSIIGKDVINKIKFVLRSPYAQRSDFDVTKIKGFDEITEMLRDNLNKPELSSSEALDIIDNLPTWSDLNKLKPPRVEFKEVQQAMRAIKKPMQIAKIRQIPPRLAKTQISENQKSFSFGLDNIIKQIKPPTVRGGIIPPELNLGKWKDKGTFSLARETLERNIDDIAGADAPKVKEFITEPIKKNELNRVEFVNNIRKEIDSKLGKIKVNSVDDKLIQQFGEGRIILNELKGKTNNWNQVSELSTYFRQKYDDLLGIINKERQKFGYDLIPKRKDYFRHFQEIGNIIDQIGLIGKKGNLPTDISGITDIFRPGKPFTTAQLKRKGGKFTESAIKGMDNYLDSVSKQIFHIDSVQRARALEKYIRITGKEGLAELPNFVANLGEYGNLLAGKAAKFDRAFESIFGRKFYQVMNTLRQRTGSNMIGANVSAAITNFIPFTQALSTTSKPAVLKGLFEGIGSPFVKEINKIDGVKSSFLTRRYPLQFIRADAGQFVKNTAGWLFGSIDKFASKSILSAKYYEGLSKGLNKIDAMKNADDYAAKVLADRSWGQLPNIFGSRTLGVLTQFQTEINNMVSFVSKDIFKLSKGNKLKIASSLGQFFIYSYLFNNVYEKVTGRRPTIDPIYATLTLAGQTSKGEGKPLKERAISAVEDIRENLPFVGGFTGGRFPIEAGLPDIMGILKGEKTLKQEAVKPAYFLAPPTGGLQIKKTIEGLTDYLRGYNLSPKGKVRFKVPQDKLSALQNILFGRYAGKTAREYFEQKQTPFSEQQSETIKGLPKEEALKQIELLEKLRSETKKDKEAFAKLKNKAQVIYDEIKSLPDNQQKTMIDKLQQSDEINKEIFGYMKDLKKAETKSNMPAQNQALSEASVDARARIIYDEIKGLPLDQQKQIIDQYQKDKILTKSVFDKMIELKKQSNNAK